MSWPRIVDRLERGETVTIRPAGQSMTPRIKSGQEVTIVPYDRAVVVGDVVLARVRGRFYLHKVTRVAEYGAKIEIGNNHGHINGWTTPHKIYGRVIDV